LPVPDIYSLDIYTAQVVFALANEVQASGL
jgi:hypothetical protein